MAIFAEITEKITLTIGISLLKATILPILSSNCILCEIGCKLVLFTNRKSRIGFHFVSKSVTLKDVMTSDVHYLCGS